MNEGLNNKKIETPKNLEELKKEVEKKFEEIIKLISDFAETIKAEKK